MKKTLFAFAAIVALATTSCKKEDTPAPAVTKEKVAGTYKVATVMMSINGGAEQDITRDPNFSYYDECQLDDTQTFNTDGTYGYVDAGVQCSPAGDMTGTWNLQSEKKITVDGNDFDIKSFNGSQLAISQTETSGGVTATVTVNLNKQ